MAESISEMRTDAYINAEAPVILVASLGLGYRSVNQDFGHRELRLVRFTKSAN
jgi:hypothetical protein